MTGTLKRRWYQFSLLSMLVVLTLVCLGPGGYVAFEQQKAREQKRSVEAIERLGGTVDYRQDSQSRSPAMRLILGDESFGDVNTVHFGISGNTNEKVTDADLQCFTRLTHIRFLCLEGCKRFTGTGIETLAGLPKLDSLDLTSTQISDDCLAHLGELKRLDHLILDDTQITDAGLTHLAKLSQLEYVELIDTRVTQTGVGNLQKKLPNCRINWRTFERAP